jgi:protein gp37
MTRFAKHKQNLKREGNFIISYETKVAEIIGSELHKLDWNVDGKTSSPTTTRHINYAAQELKLTIIETEKKSKFKQHGERAGFDMRGIN